MGCRFARAARRSIRVLTPRPSSRSRATSPSGSSAPTTSRCGSSISAPAAAPSRSPCSARSPDAEAVATDISPPRSTSPAQRHRHRPRRPDPFPGIATGSTGSMAASTSSWQTRHTFPQRISRASPPRSAAGIHVPHSMAGRTASTPIAPSWAASRRVYGARRMGDFRGWRGPGRATSRRWRWRMAWPRRRSPGRRCATWAVPSAVLWLPHLGATSKKHLESRIDRSSLWLQAKRVACLDQSDRQLGSQARRQARLVRGRVWRCWRPDCQNHLNSVIETCVAPWGLGSGAVRRGSQGHL